ncbi:MAG: DUF1330 domain-containing protein [Gemmatimonadaceae bacterium]
MPAILTTIGTLHDDGAEALGRYAAVVIPLIEAAKGTVLGRGTFVEALVGKTEDCPGFVALIQFPDAECIRKLLSSAAYRAAVPDRTKAFREIRTFICEAL